ncbi:MAG: transporter permease [Pseudonocardiales bacterium]|nr:transporter permease [Pseudonocardiales bacterium]
MTAFTLKAGVSAPSRRRSAWWRGSRFSPRTVLALIVITLLLVAAIAAPLITNHSPLNQDGELFQKPSTQYWFGTDDLGRDVFSRIVYGARTSLFAGVLAVVTGLVIGIPIGLAAGYFGRWVDAILMRIVDTLLAFPALILVIAITAALGPSLTNSMLAVGILFAPAIARLMRAQTMSVRQEQYVELAKTYGASSWRIALRHVVPNAIQPVLVQASSMFGLALLSEAGLSFLGLGQKPPQPSWGAMLAEAYGFLSRAPLQIAIPGIAIVLSVFAFNAIGDFLQDILDPRRRTANGGDNRVTTPEVDFESVLIPSPGMDPKNA